MSDAGKRLIHAAREAKQLMRYPYTHHGPTVYGSKLADYLISEHSLREDHPELFETDSQGSGK